jgi:glycosyltransferase involved in cell wall biosynthesis
VKLAIVCSWLNQYGGAERVLEVLHRMYPDAPVYTSIHVPEALPEAFRSWDIRPSFLNRVALARRHPSLFLRSFPVAFESMDLRGFDVVLSVTSAFAHGVITSPCTQHVCYCLTPARFLWDHTRYVERERLSSVMRGLLAPRLTKLRQWDQLAADRVDQFIAISRTVQARIAKYYRHESRIIYPPVPLGPPGDVSESEPFYLVVSRLVPYKRIDLAVRAFTQLGMPLRVVGDGRDRRALERIAGDNVTFLGYVDEPTKHRLMQQCRALIFPGEEDFGLTPVEAMATGTPVIAYGRGGACDTLVDGETGVFFEQPTVASLVDAVQKFEGLTFDRERLLAQAQRFDVSVFEERMHELLEAAFQKATNQP